MSMIKSPYINAVLAAGYIAIVVLLINSLSKFADGPETILIPMAMLCLFVISAAIMGLLFVYKPAELYFDSKRGEAGVFFGKTVAAFACFAVLFFLLHILLN